MLSGMTFKRELFSKETADELVLSCGPIYSHVALYLSMLKGRAFFFSPRQIVRYSENDYQNSQSWTHYAIKSGKELHSPWIEGFPKLINWAIDAQYIKADFLCTALDRTHNRVFLLADHLEKIILEALAMDEDLDYSSALSLLTNHFPQERIRYQKLYGFLQNKPRSRKREIQEFKNIYPSSIQNNDFQKLTLAVSDERIFINHPMGKVWIKKGISPQRYLNTFFPEKLEELPKLASMPRYEFRESDRKALVIVADLVLKIAGITPKIIRNYFNKKL
jgi:hypothetical protein